MATVFVWFSAVIVAAFLSVALYTDLRFRKIPNWLTVSFFVTVIVLRLLSALIVPEVSLWETLGSLAAGFALGFGLFFGLWLLKALYAADVKLMAGLGAWFGFTFTVYLLAVSSLFLIIGLVALRAHAALNAEDPSTRRKQSKGLPYAVPLALATWTLLLLQLASFHGGA